MDESLHTVSGKSETHRRILQAALEEFAQSGYKGASTRLIAERAGVNEVTLFRHFGSKLELLKAAVNDAAEQIRPSDDLDSYLSMSFRVGFRKLITDYVMQLGNFSDILTLGFVESFSNPQIADDIKGFMWNMRTVLIEYFEALYDQGRMRDLDIPVVVQMVLSLVHAAAGMRTRAPAHVTCHLTEDRIVKVLVEVLTKTYSLEQDG